MPQIMSLTLFNTTGIAVDDLLMGDLQKMPPVF